MLIIVKQLLFLILYDFCSSVFQSTVATSNWNRNSKRKYLCFKAKIITGFGVKNVMLYFNVWKEYFNHASLLLCIYIYVNLTYTSRDPGWLNWGFIIKHLVFTIGALVATQETCTNVLFPEHKNIEVWLQNWNNLLMVH